MQRILVAAVAAAALAGCQKAETPAAASAAPAPAAVSEPSREELVAKGKYIVESVGMCGDCHTPFTPEGKPDMTKMLAGAALDFAPVHPMPFKGQSPALAGLPQGCTEELLANFLETGNACDATPPLPPMPAYRMKPEDAKAVAAYLASLPKPT